MKAVLRSQASSGYNHAMAQIDEVPSTVTGAGQDKNYPNPPPLAALVLVSAPLDPNHENIGLNPAAYDQYIAGQVAGGAAYQLNLVMYDPRFEFNVELDLAQASRYNYGRVSIAGKSWYSFYTASFVNPVVSKMTPIVDPFPTFDWALGYSVFDRGHVAVAASQNDTYGDQYCLEPEPLSAPPVQGVLAAAALPDNEVTDYTVVVTSTTDLRGNGSETPYFELHWGNGFIKSAADYATQSTVDHNGAVQIDIPEAKYPWRSGSGPALEIYVPSTKASVVSTVDGAPTSGGVYLFTPGGYARWCGTMQNAPWVGDGITDIQLVPSWSLPVAGGDGAALVVEPTENPKSSQWTAAAAIPVFLGALASQPYTASRLAGWRASLLTTYGAQWYRKLVTAPFMEILMGNGSSVQRYAPDQWKSTAVGIEAVAGGVHGDPTVHVTPDYNFLGDQQGLDVAVGGAAGSVSSGWGRAASNTGTAAFTPWQSAYSTYTGREVVRLQQSLAQSQAETQARMNLGIQGIQAMLNTATSAASLNPAAVAATGAAQIGGLATAAISANNSIDLLDAKLDESTDIAAYQLGLTGVSNQQSFDTWVQSLRAMSGSGTPERLASAWRTLRNQSVDIIITAPATDRIRALLSMWRRYGYMVGRAFDPSRLDVMTHFSYWKTNGATITGAAPSAERQKIAQAFDRGVTVWNDIAEIGTDQAGVNAPVPAAYY